MHWATPFIGLPYEPGARGPHKVDCWGLVYRVYLCHFGIELPLYPGVSLEDPACTQVIKAAVAQDWKQVLAPFEGAVVAMSTGRKIHHVGVYIDADGGKVIHSLDGKQTVAENLRQLRTRGLRLIEFYKYHLWPTS